MTIEKFERIMGDHCSPVLLGIKPSNLVSFSQKETNIHDLLKSNANDFMNNGVIYDIICSNKQHYQVLFYRPALLNAYLSRPAIKSLLARDGYPEGTSLSDKLTILKNRMECGTSFPHEIGLFLGYPIEDVEGFRKNKGAGCKCFGSWKVYGDVKKAKRLFALYTGCRQFVSHQLSRGVSLCQIITERKRALNNISNRIQQYVD